MATERTFKRGTNYNHRLAWANYDPRAELAAALTFGTDRNAKCAADEHDEATSEPKQVTYVGPPGAKRRVPVGTRYCRWCQKILAEGAGPVP